MLKPVVSAAAVLSAVASAGHAAAYAVSVPSPLSHPSVKGQDVALVTLVDGGTRSIHTFEQLADLRLTAGPKTVLFTAEGDALFVPHCGGRKSVTVDGKEAALPADGPAVVPLPKGRVDVRIEIVASKYERRVACGETPRVGARETTDAGFSTLRFASPSAAKGGGVAVVYVPRGHDPKKPATLLVGVHPWNGGVWTYAQYKDLLKEADRLDVVLLHPSGLGNSLYVAEAEAEVRRAMAELEKILPVDPQRISIWGASMGGAGATTIAFHSPSRFASVTSFFGDSKYDLSTYVRTLLPDEAAARKVNALDVIENARSLPVWLIHGEADVTSPIRQSEMLEQAMRARGFTVRFDRVPAVGHEGRLVERFAGELVRRASAAVAPAFPPRVTFRSVRPEDTEAYGVKIERAVPGADAYVDIEAKGDHVTVHEAVNVREIGLAFGALGTTTVKELDGKQVPVRYGAVDGLPL